MIPNTALANTCIMSHNYHSFFMVRTFNVFSLSNFQVYNTVLLAIISMLYINQNLFILELKVCIYQTSCLPFPQLLTTTFYYEFNSFFFLKIPCVSDSIWYLSFFIWLISLSIMTSRFTHVVTNDTIP